MWRIFLAEDNPGDVLLIREALEAHRIEHELHVVADGQEAFAFVANIGKPQGAARPDLILLDMNLPKADGASILAAFRRHEACASTPVIVVSSSDSRRERAAVDGLGINRYFRKPSDFEEFMQLGAAIREVMASAGASSDAATST